MTLFITVMKDLFDSISTLAELQALINDGTRESEVLEFKTATLPFSNESKKEVAKDVSAMANSLGGVIIYGVSTSQIDKTLPEKIVPIDAKNVETFDRVLNAMIRPPIQGIRKKLIPPLNPQVLLVNVPPSEDPPHQSLYGKCYYRRSGSECLPMEHDLIALKFGRKLSPVLDIFFQSIEAPKKFSGNPLWSDQARLRIFVRNSGRRVGRYLRLHLKFPPADFVKIADLKQSLHKIDELYSGRQARQYVQNANVYHPGMDTSIAELGLSFSAVYASQKSDEPVVSWVLFADEMSPREGELFLNDLGWQELPVA
jgi:hypothetical protein